SGGACARGKGGKAFRLDGIDDSVRLPDNFLPYPTSGTSATPLSFETWFRTTSGGVILGQQGSGGYVPAVYVGTDGRLRAQMFWGGSINQVVSAGPVNDGQFHHVAVTYDGASQAVYLDGVAIATSAFTLTAYAPAYSYQLASGTTTGWPAAPTGWYYFNGQIDEPAFYNRALSAADVQAIVSAGSAGKAAPVAVANVLPAPV